MSKQYDAIVVGARCAGSPAAMLLARKGYRVLVVDKATFPSDTLSTHVLHPPAVSALKRWGLKDRLVATGCPPIGNYSFDFGPFTLSGVPGTEDSPVSYCARRTILDKLLVDAAAESGAEIREGFSVLEILTDNGEITGIRGHSTGGAEVIERARVVIGADGRNSLVAQAARPAQYNEKPPILSSYYAYYSGLPTKSFEVYIRPSRGWAAAPTHDGLTMVVGGWPVAEFEANRDDVEGNLLRAFDMAPAFAERIRSARRESRFAGARVDNYFRKPFGPGWALIGDAGYNKDPITAMGISDAFRATELCVTALDEFFTGRRSWEEAMGDYQTSRDQHSFPVYEFTCGLAALEPPPPEHQQLFAAIHGQQESMDAFARLNSGVVSPAEFFSPQNVGRIMARAGQGGGTD